MCLLGPLEPLRLSNAKGIKPPMTSFEPLSPNSVKLQESHAAVLPCSSAALLPCFGAAILLFFHAATHIVLALSKPNIQEAIPKNPHPSAIIQTKHWRRESRYDLANKILTLLQLSKLNTGEESPDSLLLYSPHPSVII